MDIRFAKENEKNNIREIWDYCFNDGPKFTDFYFKNKYNKNNTVVVDEDGEIVSSLQLNQYKIKLNDKFYDTSYIVGVSTFPQVRGKGYMKNIMDFTLKELYKKNQMVSILMPIDYRLYRKYGYEHCYDQIEYNIDIESLKSFKNSGSMKKATLYDINDLKEIYDFFLKDVNGNVKRTKEYFEKLFEEVESEDGYIYIYKEEECEGYIIYFINDDNMFVRELFYKNIESLKSMLKFVYNHNTQCKTVTISAPVNDKIRYILDNPRTSTIKIKPFMMGRVINVKKYLENLSIDSDVEGSINIFIKDDYIDENNGIFKLTLKNKILCVEKGNFDYDIKFDINTITQLVFSYIDIEEAFY
ncbi:GNAT family N-acetyltransferase [Romboutsia sp. Marseille-P6047]|uniref:GNAT family N-acetyltransferase n=1 Tax=Romboutsia sp. Marseille-P6047 TaxID=2161817 RepID=UPI001FA9C3F4|nr:GNAT family N-acetyltransferase [Romboutsia sp. Marseille-P6047]